MTKSNFIETGQKKGREEDRGGKGYLSLSKEIVEKIFLTKILGFL